MESKNRRESIEHLLKENTHFHDEFESDFRSRSRRIRIAFFCSVILNVVLVVAILVLHADVARLRSPFPPWPNSVYSPAEDAVEYEPVEFVTNLRADMSHAEKNVYLELTDEGDAAWDLLTETYATSAIPPSLAHRLNQPTASSPHEPNRYLVGLSVFHQLHCLSRIRRLLHPERYPPSYFNLSANETAVHDAHCVDLIRQTLMCHADISPVTWEWNERVGMALPSAKTMHVCRKWDPIWEWAVEHKAVGM